VVVEGEFGQIEEISLTYVTVRTWDLRRLILPITYFVENRFRTGVAFLPICSARLSFISIIRRPLANCAGN